MLFSELFLLLFVPDLRFIVCEQEKSFKNSYILLCQLSLTTFIYIRLYSLYS